MARTSRRARRLRRNALSGKQKLLGVGGIIAVGGLAAYALSQPSAPTPPPPVPGGGGPSAATCAALQAQLNQLLAAPRPDAAAIARQQAAVAQCIAAVRSAGGEVDNTTSNLSNGDSLFQQIEGWFGEYKGTEYSDALKRNNIRKNMLDAGQNMAAAYAAAVASATDPASVRAARQSIIRALDAATLRRLCYLYDQPGCGRFGVNEDHGNDKAGQEQARVIQPLLDAQALAVQKLWSQNGDVAGDNAAFFVARMRPCNALNDYLNAKFTEYKGVDYSDALRRNNLRINEVLAAGTNLVACLRAVLNDAISYRDPRTVQIVAQLARTALDAAVTRWLCYITDQPGCGRFGVNEDHGNDKAGQEQARIIGPLTAVYFDAATKLVSWGTDTSAFEPLVAILVRRCTQLNLFIGSKFNEYKSVEYSDAIRRNNLRQVVLTMGGILGGLMRDAMSTAIAGANVTPLSIAFRIAPSALPSSVTSALRASLGPISLLPTSGLGITIPPVSQVSLATPLMTLAPMASSKTSSTPAADPVVQAAVASGIRAVGTVMQAAKVALDDAITRQLCYLYDQPGCGRFGVNEDDNGAKAQQEYVTTVSPLMAAVAQGTTFLIGKGDPKAETALITSKLRYCTALNDYVNAKFNEYKGVSWSDAARRNNLRVGEVLAKGRDLVSCLRGTAPQTAYGRSLVKTVADAALAASRARVACYNDSSSPCGRFGLNEDDNATKARQETDDITNPLADIVTRLATGQALSGLGQMASDSASWVGMALLAGGAWWLLSQQNAPVRRNRPKKRRTSRRVAA